MLSRDKSIICLQIGAVLTMAGIVSWLQIRPYGLLFTLAISYWIYKVFCPAKITFVPPIMVQKKIENTFTQLMEMRREQPKVCCILISVILVTLAFIGHLISGSSILVFLLLLSGIIFARHKITIVNENNLTSPATTTDTTTCVTTSTGTTTTTTTPHAHEKSLQVGGGYSMVGSDEYDEYLPEPTESNQLLFKHAGDEAIIFQQKSLNDNDSIGDEIPSDLEIPESIPEIDENTDDDEINEILNDNAGPAVTSLEKLPTTKTTANTSSINVTTTAAAAVAPLTQIKVKKNYFTRDNPPSSSSSDDDSIISGLNFQDFSLMDGIDGSNNNNSNIGNSGRDSSSGGGVLSSISDLVTKGADQYWNKKIIEVATQAAVAAVVSSAVKQKNHLQNAEDSSSDDSEFELLNHDDLNEMS